MFKTPTRDLAARLVRACRRSVLSGTVLSGALAVAALTAPTDASACGGFFCSSIPVEQSGERVLFAVNDTTVTAMIQIFYQGEAPKFSWVLPLPAEPTKISVGSDAVFTTLEGQTNPQWNLQWNYKNDCYYSWGFAEDGDSAGPPNAGSGSADPGVTVLQAGAVGPFDFAVVKSSGTAADPAEAMYQWLDDNGFDQPEFAKAVIATYVAENHVFVAVKLQKDKSAGDIQPLVLQYPFQGSCVPLRLTSIAATDDMPIWTYVLGQDRAVPVNFFHVEIDEGKVDWLNYGQNYRDLAKQAVDTAAGRAFLTEYAGDTNSFAGLLYKPGQYDLDALKAITDPAAYLQLALSAGLARGALMQEIIRTWIPKPESLKDLTDQEFYNNLSAYSAQLASQTFDPVGMTDDIAAKLIEPMKDAQALFDDFRYLTRLFTVISPSEMTRDPIFLFNPDLPNVTNVHSALATPICDAGNTAAKKVVVTLGDGQELTYDIPQQYAPPVLEGDAASGSAVTIQRMYTAGDPEIVAPTAVSTVDKDFDSITVGLLIASNSRPTVERTKTSSASSSGCTAGPSGSLLGIGVVSGLTLAGLLVVRRRRALAMAGGKGVGL